MKSRIMMTAAAFLSLGISAPHAEEAPIIHRGTENLVAVPFHVTNDADRPIACGAALAHWYSASIGAAAPGATISATLWSNPKTGEIFVLNKHEDNMPIQRLWCGFEGQDVTSGSDVRLERQAGRSEPPITLDCRLPDAGETLRCQRQDAS